MKVFGIGVGALGSAHVGRSDRQVFDIEALDVGNEDAAGIERIDGDVEKSLNLIGVQVHRHDAVDTGRDEQVGHQLGTDRHAGTVLAVLACPAEIGHHGDHLMRRSAFGRIDHHEQFHQIVRRRERRLDDEDRASADRFQETGLKLAVAEIQYLGLSEFRAVAGYDFLCQVAGTAAGKELDFMNGHNSLKGFDGANISILRKGGKRFPLFFKNPSNICR